jgi:hypothetical protein
MVVCLKYNLPSLLLRLHCRVKHDFHEIKHLYKYIQLFAPIRQLQPPELGPKIQCPEISFANSGASKLEQFFARTEMAHIRILVGQSLLEMPKNGINQPI